MTEPPFEPLDRLLGHLREEPPSGLEDRILRGLADPRTARRMRWQDLDDDARLALRLSVVVFVLLAALVAAFGLERSALHSRPPVSAPAPVTPTPAKAEDELLAMLTPETPLSLTWPMEAR